ncbi:MAG: hypothetical protein JWP34_3179, partial [Massilia sp.]|nr:hypothetical protein [Massilia sp.]
ESDGDSPDLAAAYHLRKHAIDDNETNATGCIPRPQSCSLSQTTGRARLPCLQLQHPNSAFADKIEFFGGRWCQQLHFADCNDI